MRVALDEALRQGPLSREEAIALLRPYISPSRAVREYRKEKARVHPASLAHEAAMAVRRRALVFINERISKGYYVRMEDGKIELASTERRK